MYAARRAFSSGIQQHCIRRSDLELLPKGDKLARLLHIS